MEKLEPVTSAKRKIAAYRRSFSLCTLIGEITEVMVVRLRLARFGKKRQPMYKIFAADARCPRDGRHLEVRSWNAASRSPAGMSGIVRSSLYCALAD